MLYTQVCKAQGTVMIVGIDTEYGSRPSTNSHGSIADWCNIINTGLLANVTNGKSDILVIGGGKSSSNDVKKFWNQVSACLGRSVTYKHRQYWWNSISPILGVNFNDFALVVVATDHSDVDGHLRESELNALNIRKNDMADFICKGGALFASSCEYNNPYGYMSKLGNVSVTSQSYSDITPTIAGSLIGITNTNLDIGPWHIIFNSFPGFLKVLAVNNLNAISAIGGRDISVMRAKFTLPKSTFCQHDVIIADASGSLGAGSYFWSIQESDANWNRYGPEISDWFTGAPTSTNLSDFAASKGFTFKCNTYYRIKLAIGGLCKDWLDTTELIQINCPEVNAGPDACVKCTVSGATIQLGITNSAGQTYSWSPAIGLSNPSSATPIHQIGSVMYPITYTATATNRQGCTATDQVTLFCEKPSIKLVDTAYCCGITLNCHPSNYNSIVWSTGEANTPSINITTAGTYQVTVSNPCGSVSQSIVVPAASMLTGFFNPIAYNSKFYPPSGGNGLKDKLYIMDVLSGNGAANIPNSYNATSYLLEIFDRWGNLVKSKEDYGCFGFDNWTINWDGNDQSGNPVQQDEYVWRLHMKNCQYKEWTCPKERKFVNPSCLDWATFLGIKLWCKEWSSPVVTTVDVEICTGHVTLVR